MNFFGNSYRELFVNDNGNITFENPLGEYTPFVIDGSQAKIIAPFFADVDTTSAGSQIMYGQDNVKGLSAFGVNWLNVDYYDGNVNHKGKNDFQLVIIERSDVSLGDFDIEFNYRKIQWESGTNSGGDEFGLGGTSVRVGWSNGLGTNGKFFELPGSGINGAFLDDGSSSLTKNSYNANISGRYVFEVRNGILINPLQSEIHPPQESEFFNSSEGIALVGGVTVAAGIGTAFAVALKVGLIGTKAATVVASTTASSVSSGPASSSSASQSGAEPSSNSTDGPNFSIDIEISGGIE